LLKGGERDVGWRRHFGKWKEMLPKREEKVRGWRRGFGRWKAKREEMFEGEGEDGSFIP